MDFISIHNVLFEVLNYQVSSIELISTIAGLICVWYGVKANILTWPIGIINAIGFGILFYQVNLYSDMFLQVWFVIISIYGWVKWKKVPVKKTISYLKNLNRIMLAVLISVVTFFLGSFMANIHLTLPEYFSHPAAYPYFDAFTTSASIIAVILMSLKKIECWILWILIDIVCIILYLMKGVLFVSIEYVVFFVMALSGLIFWLKLYKNEKRASIRKIHAIA